MNRKERRATEKAKRRRRPHPLSDAPKSNLQLAIALEHHRAGQVPDAAQIYQEILAAHPGHVEALAKLEALMNAGPGNAPVLPHYLREYQQGVLQRRQSSFLDYPAHVHLETLALCNASCNFCPYPSLERKGAVMADFLIEKIVNDLADIPHDHRFQLSPFKVNEPFLDKRLLDLLTLFERRLPNASITLTTNASPITEGTLERLAAFTTLGYLWISFNDHREPEYEATMGLPYRRTIDRLQMIHKAKADGVIPMRIVVSRVSDGTPTDRAFAEWVAINFPLFEVSLFPRGEWLGQVLPTSSQSPAVGCIRWFDLSITATGVVAHCCMDGKAEFPIGNVNHMHVLDIYNQPQYRRLRAELETRQEAHPCRNCSFL